ncbi:MAG: hypothetical protein HQL33_03510 [Alphaproteobacteria bacterium]|nr:hypothetical protein [Alphaproteobacteria bacterium]
MALLHRKVLLVEGNDDMYAVIQLMAEHIPWGNTKDKWPVRIEPRNGIDEVPNRFDIPTRLKSREVEILGIIVDADEVFADRWTRLRELCQEGFPDLPDVLPETGLIAENDEGKRLGIWIMPDNASRGMLETFLRFLVPQQQDPIWEKAQKAVDEAIALGAKCRPAHRDKSNIHTWLAWQDPPGEAFGNALVKKILDPHAPHAAPFVDWFCALFQIDDRVAP